MGVDVVDSSGASLRGTVGELAIRTPWPGMTRSFWAGSDDADASDAPHVADERYLDAYWRRLEGLWIHGDWALVDDDGFWYLLGRSDDTLKVAGKRVGPAEVEAAAVAHPAVVEAAAIGIPDSLKGESIVVLAMLRPDARDGGRRDGRTIASEIADLVVRDLGKTCRPAAVVLVPDLPRTRSGKIMRRVARAAYLHGEPGDLSALENPAAVAAIAAAAPR
jgi:acetyl-CoA synthetase